MTPPLSLRASGYSLIFFRVFVGRKINLKCIFHWGENDGIFFLAISKCFQYTSILPIYNVIIYMIFDTEKKLFQLKILVGRNFH